MGNLLFVISGPSGVGKGTIVKRLLDGGNFALSVSCTTRAKRAGEVNGVHYFFISKAEFEKEIASGGFLEYSNHFGNYYGTPKKYVEQTLKKRDVLLEIDVDGALRVKSAHPEAVLIMIIPPSEEELRRRLLTRGVEDGGDIENRIARMKYELSKKDKYDYCVVNDDLAAAVEEIKNIIEKEKGAKK